MPRSEKILDCQKHRTFLIIVSHQDWCMATIQIGFHFLPLSTKTIEVMLPSVARLQLLGIYLTSENPRYYGESDSISQDTHTIPHTWFGLGLTRSMLLLGECGRTNLVLKVQSIRSLEKLVHRTLQGKNETAAWIPNRTDQLKRLCFCICRRLTCAALFGLASTTWDRTYGPGKRKRATSGNKHWRESTSSWKR